MSFRGVGETMAMQSLANTILVWPDNRAVVACPNVAWPHSNSFVFWRGLGGPCPRTHPAQAWAPRPGPWPGPGWWWWVFWGVWTPENTHHHHPDFREGGVWVGNPFHFPVGWPPRPPRIAVGMTASASDGQGVHRIPGSSFGVFAEQRRPW